MLVYYISISFSEKKNFNSFEWCNNIHMAVFKFSEKIKALKIFKMSHLISMVNRTNTWAYSTFVRTK